MGTIESATTPGQDLSTIPAKNPDGPSRQQRGIELIGSEDRCQFTYRIGYVETESGTYQQKYVTCGRWVCRYCRQQRIEVDRERYADALRADGRRVYVESVPDRDKATNVVRYATRLGHSALVIPQEDGTAIVFTTQPRRRAQLVEGTEMERVIEPFLTRVPAYTAEEGEHRVVNVNQVLRGHLLDDGEYRAKQRAQQSGHEFDLDDYHRFRDQRPPRVYGNSSFDATLEFLDLVTKRDRFGRIIEARIPTEDDPKDWAKALFWHEYRQLQQVALRHAA